MMGLNTGDDRTFQQLVDDLKNAQKSAAQLEKRKEATKQAIREAAAALKGVELKDPFTVQSLLDAKLRECELNVRVMPYPATFEGLEPDKGSSAAMIGVYPQAAFNIYVYEVSGAIVVYYSPVPKQGNLR